MTAEIKRPDGQVDKITQTPMTKWVLGITAVLLVGWMGWVSQQLLKGGRFTVADGQRIGQMLHAHTAIEGHAVMAERVVGVKTDLEEMKVAIGNNSDKLDEVLSRLPR